MGLAKLTLNKSVFLDTAPLIYFIEGNSVYKENLNELFLKNSKGKIQFHVSVLTLLEVLVLPLKLNKTELADQYQNILTNSKHIKLFEINTEISIIAAKLRAKYSLKTPDSIQLATSICYKADYFLTNDKQLKKVNEIQILILDDL